MPKLKLRTSPSFEQDVMKQAEKMAKEGKTKEVLEIKELKSLNVYIDTVPAKTLHIFEGPESSENLKGKKIYVGTDA